MLKPLAISALVAVAVLFAVLFAAAPTPTRFLPKPPAVGDIAPEIHAAHWVNSTAPRSLAMLRNKHVVLEFWATWCEPCIASIPHMNALQDRYGDRVEFLALTAEPIQKVLPAVEKYRIKSIIGAGSMSFDVYAPDAIPYVLLIAPDGKILWIGDPNNTLDEALEKALGLTQTRKDTKN